MIIVKIKGGLGNQMFQYAFARYLNENTKQNVKIDLSYFEIYNDSVRKPRIATMNIGLQIATKKEVESLVKFKGLFFNKKHHKIAVLLNSIFKV